jgi:hypothetical protein
MNVADFYIQREPKEEIAVTATWILLVSAVLQNSPLKV